MIENFETIDLTLEEDDNLCESGGVTPNVYKMTRHHAKNSNGQEIDLLEEHSKLRVRFCFDTETAFNITIG